MDTKARAALVRACRLEIKAGEADMRDFIVSRETVTRVRRGAERVRAGADRLGRRIKRRVGREIDHQLAEYRRRDRAFTRRINMAEAARVREHGPDISPDFTRRSARVARMGASLGLRAQAGSGVNRWRGTVAQVGQDARARHPAPAPAPRSNDPLDWNPTDAMPARTRRRATITRRRT